MFLPDPSIGRWAQWRQPAGADAFPNRSNSHYFHSAALGLLRIAYGTGAALGCPDLQQHCGSRCGSGGSDVREQLLERLGVSKAAGRLPRPQLPVIPLPLPIEAFEQPAPAEEAKRSLGLPENCPVLLWLGRLSLLTKLDPWPTYQMLERVSQRLAQPIVLLECGPDDHPSQAEHLNAHRQLCPSVQFVRLGGRSRCLKDQASGFVLLIWLCLLWTTLRDLRLGSG